MSGGHVRIVLPLALARAHAASIDGDGDGFLVVDGDCDDTDATVHPGHVETCDGRDQDCDGAFDEDSAFVALWHDLDADTYGAGETYEGCEAADANQAPDHYYVVDPTGGEPYLVTGGYVTNADDCNDFNSTISPDAVEVCDERDNDCDVIVDDVPEAVLWYVDRDGDGYGAGEGTLGCSAPTGRDTTEPGDCDDSDESVHPGARDVANGVDDDCDGVLDDDPLTEEEKTPAPCTCSAGSPAVGVVVVPLLACLRQRRDRRTTRPSA